LRRKRLTGFLERHWDRSDELLSDRLGFTAPRRLATLEAVGNNGRQHGLDVFRQNR
jgi:hypothetical protein